MLNIAEKALYYALAVFLNPPLLWYFPKTNLFIWLKQKSKMFNKLCFTRSRSRTRSNSEDGAICTNILLLKAIYYSIVTRSSILNVGIRMSFVCHSYVIHMFSYITRMWIQFNTILHLVRMSLVCARMWLVCHSYVIRMYSYITRMSLVSACHSYVFVYHPYVTSIHPYVTSMCSYVIRMSLVFGFTMNFFQILKHEKTIFIYINIF